MPNSYPKRIVIIDDYDDALHAFADVSVSLNLTVKTADGGHRGIELVRMFLPKIVLCDLSLPDMTGMEVARSIRSMSTLYKPFLVSMSYWGDFHTMNSAIVAGFDLHLTKPFDKERVLMLIEKAYLHPFGRKPNL